MPAIEAYSGHPASHQEFLSFARLLAETSGRFIMQHFGTDISVEHKYDASPVTIADKGAEELIRKAIQDEYPEHGIIGEEFGEENPDADYTWIIDPIDGTKSFISGTPLFGTLIALAHYREPILGLIHLPALNQLFTGTSGVADCNGTPVRMRQCSNLTSAVLLTTDHKDAVQVYGHQKLDSLINGVRFYRTWGDCYGYTLLCNGFADVMIDPVLAPWDMYALLPVVKGAGGIVTDMDGGNPLKSGNIVAAHPSLHAQVLENLRHSD